MRTTSNARHPALLLFSVAVLLAGGAAAVRGQSALDGFDPNANGGIFAIVVQPDGKILLGGDFTTLAPNGGALVTRNRIARLNPDGTLDTAFNPNANLTVRSITVQADGKILAGGDFTSIGGQTRNHIARLEATTGLAESWNPNADNSVTAVLVQADGKVLIGGAFTAVGALTRNRLARLDAVTGLADSFNPNANDVVNTITVQTDGKILTGGLFSNIGGQPRNGMARLDPVTGAADSWNPTSNSNVTVIAVQADGKILAGGQFTNIGGQTRNRIARLDPVTGTADSFNPNANDRVLSIVVQTDGKVLAGGDFTTLGGSGYNRIGRFNPDGTLDAAYDPNADGEVLTLALQQDGKVLVGGIFNLLSPNGGAAVMRNDIARLEIDGRLDQTLNLSTVGDSVFATALQPDGKILIGGAFTEVLGQFRNNIARLNPDGTLDTAFNPNANSFVSSIALQADGKILVGGTFTTIGGVMRNNIARLDATTGLADSFNPDANFGVNGIAVQADGKILAGGQFTSIGGQTRNRIARLDATTGLADSFDPNANSGVNTIAVQADGKILAGGDFNGANSIGGQTRNRIARLDATTGLADSFDPNPNGSVLSIAVQADGKILAGGAFNIIGGQTRNNIARLDGTTGAADSFNPNAMDFVLSIAVQADGKILAGGIFTSIGGQTRNRIARLDATTGLADSFDPNANSKVRSIAVQADGKILAGGDFTSIGGQTRDRFARLSNDTAALQNLAVMESAITWTRAGASPQLTRVTFESSTDNVNYALLGNGTAAGSNWVLTGLSLPTQQNIYIRARGYYRGGVVNGSESIAESVRNAFVATPPTILGNISTRLRVETGDNVLIGGFIITGTQPKKVLVRAIGPSLALAGKLENPSLELNGPGGLIMSNDDWKSTQQAEIEATTIPPTNDLESAIVATLPANAAGYTAIVRGVNNTTGIALVEAYDLDRTVDSKLANISTRGLVQTGDNVMIGGFILLGTDAQKVLVRAIGPSLPVPGTLGDPTLELHDANGVLFASNDNWRDTQEAEIIASTIPPTDDAESAIVQTLAPAAYTAIVSGVNGTSGVALVEVYALSP